MRLQKLHEGRLLPDDKAAKYGMSSLTDAELLAIILRSGTRECNVLELTERIVHEIGGNIGGIVSSGVDGLDSIKGIGRVKKLQMTAIGELSRRIWNSRRDLRVPLSTPEAVFEYFREDLRHADTEEVHLALLDVKCRLIRHVPLSKGTLHASPLCPRDVFESALRYHAASFIVIHNHPSGDSTPSKEDISVTKTLRELGQSMQLPMLDHIIVGNPGYYSFKDAGAL